MYEAGDVSRFASVGDIASYARCVEARRLSELVSWGHIWETNLGIPLPLFVAGAMVTPGELQ